MGRKIMKTLFYIVFISIVVLILMNFTQFVYATEIGDLTGRDAVGYTYEIRNIGNKIIQIMSVIGSIISVIVLIVLGIKYMAGSVDEKAEYKKTLMPYVIGAGLIFAASSIAAIFYNLVTNL